MRLRSGFRIWVTGFGAIGAATFFYPSDDNDNQLLRKHNPWITLSPPWAKWDHNWDRMDPKSLVRPMTINNEADQNKYNQELAKKTAKAIRHIILIRHGQYNVEGNSDPKRILTELGRQQAEITGKRLQTLRIPYTVLVHSTMARAQETASIIKKSLGDIEVQDDLLLNEGSPIQPEPPSRWYPETRYYRDGPRIEAAFRKYFHRAECSEGKDSYTILVCHANVIRYFVCRALQFPPESWLRLNLNHASITWVTIHPDGTVIIQTLNNTGHMKPQLIS